MRLGLGLVYHLMTTIATTGINMIPPHTSTWIYLTHFPWCSNRESILQVPHGLRSFSCPSNTGIDTAVCTGVHMAVLEASNLALCKQPLLWLLGLFSL